MEYSLRYVLTPREYAKLVHFVGTQSGHGRPRKTDAEPRHVEFVRQYTRLFFKAWAAGASVNTAAKARGRPQIHAARLAATLAACAASYRIIFNHIQSTSSSTKGIVAGAIAGYILATLPSTYATGYAGIYLTTKVCEWAYNWLDDCGFVDWKPRVFGTWLLFPVAMGQLFYALILHPDACPRGFRRLMVLLSNGAVPPPRPNGFPRTSSWPSETDFLRSIGEVSEHGFTRFRGPLVYESDLVATAPRPVIPLLRLAHPGNTSMVGALLHPATDSAGRAFLECARANFSLTTKYLLPLYLLKAYFDPDVEGLGTLKQAVVATLRTAVFTSMASSTAWSGIELSEKMLGRRMLPTTRFWLIGFMSGLWAIADQEAGKARFLYAVRLAIMSQYTVFRPRFSRKHATILLTLSLAGSFAILNAHPQAVSQRFMRKLGTWVQTGKWRDPLDLEQQE